MKWTRVEKHWQELASKANAEAGNARLEAGPRSQADAELGTRDSEPTVDADPQAPLVDDPAGQAKQGFSADLTSEPSPADRFNQYEGTRCVILATFRAK